MNMIDSIDHTTTELIGKNGKFIKNKDTKMQELTQLKNIITHFRKKF